MDFSYLKTVKNIKLTENEINVLKSAFCILDKTDCELKRLKNEEGCDVSAKFNELEKYLDEYTRCMGYIYDIDIYEDCDSPVIESNNNDIWIPIKSYKDIPKKSGLDILASCKLDGDYWVIRTQYEKGKWNDNDIKYANAYFIIPEEYGKED